MSSKSSVVQKSVGKNKASSRFSDRLALPYNVLRMRVDCTHLHVEPRNARLETRQIAVL